MVDQTLNNIQKKKEIQFQIRSSFQICSLFEQGNYSSSLCKLKNLLSFFKLVTYESNVPCMTFILLKWDPNQREKNWLKKILNNIVIAIVFKVHFFIF